MSPLGALEMVNMYAGQTEKNPLLIWAAYNIGNDICGYCIETEAYDVSLDRPFLCCLCSIVCLDKANFLKGKNPFNLYYF